MRMDPSTIIALNLRHLGYYVATDVHHTYSFHWYVNLFDNAERGQKHMISKELNLDPAKLVYQLNIIGIVKMDEILIKGAGKLVRVVCSLCRRIAGLDVEKC